MSPIAPTTSPIIAAGQSASGSVGAAFAKTFSLIDSANRPATSWAATGLPGWATLNAITGAITGTPQDRGTTTITLTATGPGGASEATTATILIVVGKPIILASQSFNGKFGEEFDEMTGLSDALDRPASSWGASFLPPGLLLDSSSGRIYGTPTVPGNYRASIWASGIGGTSPIEGIDFAISEGVPIIFPGQMLWADSNSWFSGSFSVNSQNRRVASWSASGLPSWATINSNSGAVSGYPDASGLVNITLTATGPGGASTESVAIMVVSSPPVISESQSFACRVAENFSGSVLLDGDVPARSWSVTGLPAGLSINSSTGQITGVPSVFGSFTANFKAFNPAGESDGRAVEFVVAKGAPSIKVGQVAFGYVGQGFGYSFIAEDLVNRPISSWGAYGLPSWASIDAVTGIIDGIPNKAENSEILLTATGEGGQSSVPAMLVVEANSVYVGEFFVAQGFKGSLYVKTASFLGSERTSVNMALLQVKFFQDYTASVDSYLSGEAYDWDYSLEVGGGLNAVWPVLGVRAVYVIRNEGVPKEWGKLEFSVKMDLVGD